MKKAGIPLIAVVDDDYRILESLESLLESAGHQVQLFLSAEDFLDAGIILEIDCLISDVGMPEMDGYMLVQQVLLGRPSLPVIMITGLEDMTYEDAAKIGPERFFTKPFNGRNLLRAVADAIGNRTSKLEA